MKRILLFIIVSFATINVFAQTQTTPTPVVSPDSEVIYRLFATRNTWNFIKLNTRNGKMWQVQWHTGDERFEVPLSSKSLVVANEEKNGRFFLYPTTNMYNFILLDQIDGRTWQVQWSTEIKDRAVIEINRP